MKFLERILGRSPRPTAANPTSSPVKYVRGGAENVGALSGFGVGAGPQYYEALRSSEARTRILTAWFMAGSDLSRRELSLLARALYDNGGHAALAVDMLAQYSTPVLSEAASPDRKWNEEADAYFDAFAERADFLGRPDVDLSAIQYIASTLIDLDGDTLPVLTSEAGFPQIQLIEGHRISSPAKVKEGIRIESGVEWDRIGRIAAYHVDNGDDTWTRVPAGSAYLLRDLSPVAPVRGMSSLRRGLNDLRDARDIIAFEKTAVKQSSAMPGWIKGVSSDDPRKDFKTGDDDDKKPPAEEMPSKIARVDLTGGEIPVLEDGREFVSVTPTRPNVQFGDFIDALVGLFAAGIGIPPAFFLDSKMTGPGWRAVIGKAQRRFNQRQNVMAGFQKWLRVRITAHGIENGELKEIEGWQRVAVQRPARLTIDLGDEEAADLAAYEARLLTRAAYHSKRQRSADDELTKSIAEDARLIEEVKNLAKKTGVDEEILLNRYGFRRPKASGQSGNQQDSKE